MGCRAGDPTLPVMVERVQNVSVSSQAATWSCEWANPCPRIGRKTAEEPPLAFPKSSLPPKGTEMIPAYLIHKTERQRTPTEQRAALCA